MLEYMIPDVDNGEVNDLFNPISVGARPFLKWAGGKKQLLDKFNDLYPNELKQKKIKNYYEPFLGSGAVFFNVVQLYDVESAFLYDINDDLILTYKVIQNNLDDLLYILKNYDKKYKEMNALQRANFYYEVRQKYNSGKCDFSYSAFSNKQFERAAQFILLNKTCFNGLYRVNSKGDFNSPAGVYENPTICDEINLRAVNKVLQIAEIKKADFKQIIVDLKDKSFVYFDPPYRPISKTSNFKAYSKEGFSDREQIDLANVFKIIDKKESKVMLSNSDPKNHNPHDTFFDDIYKGYNIYRIPAKRFINSDAKKRGSINEIVVTNYCN